MATEGSTGPQFERLATAVRRLIDHTVTLEAPPDDLGAYVEEIERKYRLRS